MSETKTKTTRTKKTAEKEAVAPVAEKKTTKTTSANSTLEIPVYNLSGKEEKTVELPKELFGVEESPRLVAQYVRVYLANRRQGTASTKQRSEVVGTTKKVYRQKGTGGARHGSKKAPIYVGGGVSGGPKPTDHSLKINKKQKRKALLSVLTTKAKEHAIIALGKDVVEMKPKTKEFAAMLKTIGVNDQKVMLVVTQSPEEGLKLSTRNLENVNVVSPSNVNPYNLLTNKKIVFTEDALTVLSSLYLKK
jgi:large subunit ribosomal protein L4